MSWTNRPATITVSAGPMRDGERTVRISLPLCEAADEYDVSQLFTKAEVIEIIEHLARMLPSRNTFET